nr:hypothetical protein Iba_chr07aCG7460 [Ipomoea batatas]
MSSNIFSTLTTGGARLNCGFSSNTSKGGSTLFKDTIKDFIKSLTRPRISQRAEKFTTAQRSIFAGSTSFCPSHFHLPFRVKKSSPFPTFNCGAGRTRPSI